MTDLLKRVIKFRAWDKEDNTMDYCGFERLGNYHELMDNPIMQFTGLNDKNGKEIYEGDIVNFINIDEPHFTNPCVIEFLNYGWHPFKHGIPMPSDIDIIGNIYENPELLEKSND
jgi:hypothetical protein